MNPNNVRRFNYTITSRHLQKQENDHSTSFRIYFLKNIKSTGVLCVFEINIIFALPKIRGSKIEYKPIPI